MLYSMFRIPQLDYLRLFCEKYPSTGAALWQVHADLKLVRGWNVEVYDAEDIGRCVLIAQDDQEETHFVVPMDESTSITPKILLNIFNSSIFTSPTLQKPCIIIGIVAQDSTTAYYKVHKGIAKPKDTEEKATVEVDEE